MKAKDLMPGDLVMSFGQVTEIWMIDASHEDEKDQLINYLDAREFEPIPLTEEIFDKNGYTHDELAEKFIVDNDACYMDSKDHRITISNNKEYINSNHKWYVHVDSEDFDTEVSAEVTFVHQFQHTLRLCEIEKEIQL